MNHVCGVCAKEAWEHEPRCSIGEPRTVKYLNEDGSVNAHNHNPFHLHDLPLCCPQCECLSYEAAHPEAVGHPLESLTEILGNPILSKRTRTALARYHVYTAERLYDIWEHNRAYLHHMAGIGPRARGEISSFAFRWTLVLNTETVPRLSLPEDADPSTWTPRVLPTDDEIREVSA